MTNPAIQNLGLPGRLEIQKKKKKKSPFLRCESLILEDQSVTGLFVRVSRAPTPVLVLHAAANACQVAQRRCSRGRGRSLAQYCSALSLVRD